MAKPNSIKKVYNFTCHTLLEEYLPINSIKPFHTKRKLTDYQNIIQEPTLTN